MCLLFIPMHTLGTVLPYVVVGYDAYFSAAGSVADVPVHVATDWFARPPVSMCL